MRNERRVLRNTVVLTCGEALGQLANLLFVAAFARTYGIVEMGHYSLGMALGAVASLAVSFGTQGYLLRELSHSPQLAGRRIGAIAPWQALAVLLIGAVVALVGTAREAGLLVMLATVGYQLIYRAAGLYFVPFRATEQMTLPVVADLGQRLLTLVIGSALMLAGASPAATALTMLLSATSFALLGRWRMQREFGVLEHAPAREAWWLLRQSWPFFGTLALAVVYARGAPILLGFIRGAESVGGYAAADRLLVVATLVPAMYASAALPSLSRVARQQPQDVQPLATRLLRILAVVTLTTAATLVTFAPELVTLVFGPAYAGASLLLRVLALAIPVQAMEQLLAAQLSATGHQQLLLRTRLVSLVCFVVLGSLAVHYWGAPGLAASVVACSLLQLAGCIYHLARRAQLPLKLATLAAPAAAAVAAVAGTLLLGGLPLVARAAVFVAILAAVGWIAGAVRPHDIRFARSLLTRDGGTDRAA